MNLGDYNVCGGGVWWVGEWRRTGVGVEDDRGCRAEKVGRQCHCRQARF